MTVPALNTRNARRWFAEVWNARDEVLLEQLMAADVIGEAEGGRIVGRDAWVSNVYRVFLAAFPDLQLDIIGTVAEGDEVVLRWRALGTHSGDGLGVPATGMQLSFRGMTWMKFRDGQIVEGCDSWNQNGLLLALQTRQSVGSAWIRG